MHVTVAVDRHVVRHSISHHGVYGGMAVSTSFPSSRFRCPIQTNIKTTVKPGDVLGVDLLDDAWKDMSCALDRADELSTAWLAEQRRLARLAGGRHAWASPSGSAGSSASRRYEPVLKIAVPDFESVG